MEQKKSNGINTENEERDLNQEIAEITLSFSENFGIGEINSAESVLIRPFRVLLEEGRKVGRVNYLFYRENESQVYTFGALCYAPSRRLLFFPGLANRTVLWHSKVQNFIQPQGVIDHFTVEPDFQSWHVTTLINGTKENRKKWLPQFKLFELEKDIYFWFGLSIQKPDVLELTPQKIKWPFLKGNSKNIERKINIIMQAREGAKFHILQLPEKKKENAFLHFDVLIDKRGRISRWFKQINLKSVAPFNKPALIQEINPTQKFITRTHKVKLVYFNGDIIICVSQHQGVLSDKTIITNPEI